MVDMNRVRELAEEKEAAALANEQDKAAEEAGVPTGSDTIMMDEVRDRTAAMMDKQGVVQENLLSGALEPKTVWNTPQSDPTLFDSFVSGLGDSITVGNYGTYKAGYEATGSPLMGYLNLMSNVILDPIIDDTMEEEEVDRELSDNPKTALTGQLAGSLITAAAGGTGLAAGATRAGPWTFAKVANIGNKVAPWVTRTGQFLRDTSVGRLLGATVAGAGEGGVYSYSKGENVAGGIISGGAGGLAGQAVLGEGLPYMLGGKSQTTARQALGNAISSDVKSSEDITGHIPYQSMIERARELGPRGTVADTSTGGMSFAESKLGSPHRHEEMFEFERTARNRAGDPITNPTGRGSIVADYKRQMADLLPAQFLRPAATINSARPMDIIATDKKAYFEGLSKQFGDVLAKSDVRYNPRTVRRQTTKFLTEGTPDLVARADKAQIDKIFTNVIPTKQVPKKGGARGEKVVQEQLVTPSQLHTARTDLDRMINSEFEKAIPDNDRVRRLSNARNYISAQLAKVEDFSEMNAKYATEGGYERAAQVGHDLLNTGQKSLSPDRVRAILTSSTDYEVQGMLEGVSRRIVEDMAASGGEMRTARKIARDDNVGEKLISVFGQEKGQAMIDATNRALDLSANTHRLISGSDTGRRATLAAKDKPNSNLLDIGLITGALVSTFTNTHLASTAGAAGALRRILPGQVDPAETMEMGRLLSQQGGSGVSTALTEMQQALDTSSGVRTFSGLDKTLAARQAGLPPSLMTTDIGQAPAFSFDNLTNYMLQNEESMAERRSDRREAEATGRE